MTTGTAPQCNPMFQAGTVTLALDAPQQSVSTQPLPNNFRSMSNLKITGNTASGSAQYSLSQLQAMISQKVVTTPLVIVDLRQEFHGFLNVNPALYGENEIAVGWFVERDWINVDKDLPSINAFEPTMLGNVSNSSPVVYQITSKTPTEDGICTANPNLVKPTGFNTEQQLVQSLGHGYFRFPTTDHCRPRDHEVDQFIAFEQGLTAGTWLHFHCRAGDGRTTVFMAMHDIFNNALDSQLQDILTRQGPTANGGIGGIDLATEPKDQADFDYPFSQDRVQFMQLFYSYVVQQKANGFQTTWSDWVFSS